MKEIKSNYFLKIAYKLALTSDYDRFRLGAVITKRNRIISFGTNSKKSHPLQAKFSHRPHLNSWRHAEIHAISLAKEKDLVGSYMYVSRVLKNDEWATSKPCPGCTNAMKAHGIKGVYYHKDGLFYYEDCE